jgi:hypothetical protein
MNHNHKKIIINKLFPCPPSKNFNNLMIDDDSVSYITTPMNSEVIAGIIESLIPKNISRSDVTILDGTACVGGDTISFGRIFGVVIATEIEEHRYNMLVNNLKEFELYNVVPVNDDCLKIFRRLNFVDVMYFDPPWGGKSYKTESLLRLSIGDLYVDELVNLIFDKNTDSNKRIRSNVKMIVFKLPKNYDIKNLYLMTKSSNLTMLMYDLNKMLIVVFTPLKISDNMENLTYFT